MSGVVDVDEHCGVCELCCPLNGLAVGLALSLAHVQAGTHVLNRVANLSAFGYFGGFDLPDEARVVLVERFPTNKVRFVELGRVHCIVAVLHANESVVSGEDVVVTAVFEGNEARVALQPCVEFGKFFVNFLAFLFGHRTDLLVCIIYEVGESLELGRVAYEAGLGACTVDTAFSAGYGTSSVPVAGEVAEELVEEVFAGRGCPIPVHNPDVGVGP